MKSFSKKLTLITATALSASLSMPAMAQTATPASEAAEDSVENAEIVVTGTLLRGAEVVGAQTISVDAKAITDKGATSTNELLGLIPQISNTFNGRFEGDPRGFSAGLSINRPNLRNLPSANTTSGALTLVLLDGVRATPVGVNQASVDVDVIPAAVLAGVDVVTDGGSSLYGADAVAGVINFRTLKEFDGVKIDVNSGFGTTFDGYSAWDAAITAGKKWSGGSAYISVGRSERDGILNGDTDFATGQVFNAAGVGSFSFTQCPNPVGTETRFFRFGPGAAQFTNNPAAPGAGTFPVGTPCDAITAATYVPKQERSNVFASLSQEISDTIDLRVIGYWTKRDTEIANFPRGFTSAGSPLTTGALVGQAFPNAPVGSITVIPGGTGFSFVTNPAYVDVPTRVGFETWGVTPELTIKFGNDWQVRNSAHFGRSTNKQRFSGVNTVSAQAAINAGQLNPRNAAAASAAVITDILNFENAQDTKHQLVVLRSIVDGSLFALPGGDVKLAVGVEYQHNRARSRLNTGTIGSLAALPFRSEGRNAKSVYAELSVPVTSFIDVNGSVRYDDYSDFGSTTNPSIGFALKPASWLKIFGHWNTSFNAPTALDNLAIGTGRFVCGIYVAGSTNPAQRPTDPLGRDTSRQGTCALVLQGSPPGLKPQTAETWAVGFEVKPSSNLRFGGNFYSIDAKNTLGTLNPSNLATYVTNPDLYTYNVNSTGFAAVLAQLTNGATLAGQQVFSDVGLIVDTRTSNLNSAKIEGIDFNANFNFDVGSTVKLAIGVNGNLDTKAVLTNGGVTSDQLGIADPKLAVSTFVGLAKGPLSGKVTVNYSGKFKDQAVNNLGVVETVDPFTIVNVNLGYDFGEIGDSFGALSVRLIIDNLFEKQPQTIRRLNTNNLSYNNFTLGRVIKLGASIKF